MGSTHRGATPCNEADVEELAGMTARRIAVIEGRASGMTWKKARLASLNATADDKIKSLICKELAQGVEYKQAIHNVVIKITKG